LFLEKDFSETRYTSFWFGNAFSFLQKGQRLPAFAKHLFRNTTLSRENFSKRSHLSKQQPLKIFVPFRAFRGKKNAGVIPGQGLY